MEKSEKGITAIYIPPKLYDLCEEARKRLGMSRSRFYQYCIMRVLQELNVLSTTIHEPEKNLSVVST